MFAVAVWSFPSGRNASGKEFSCDAFLSENNFFILKRLGFTEVDFINSGLLVLLPVYLSNL